MGTNFYWSDNGSEGGHIGKRSAAGLFCWDCNETLCIGGFSGIHRSSGFHDSCQKCGAVKVAEGWESSGGVELGFATPRRHRPKGVRSCSSFSWATDSMLARIRCAEESENECVIDEYGRKLKGREFLAMLENNCPVQFFDSIGVEFC